VTENAKNLAPHEKVKPNTLILALRVKQ